MLPHPVRALLSFDSKAVLAVIVVAMTLLGSASWGAMTLLDYDDTLARAQREVRQAAALLERQAASVLEAGAAAVTRVADRLEAGGLPVEAAALPAPGALSVVDRAGRLLFGPEVALDRGRLATLLEREGKDIRLLPGHAGGEPSVVLARRLAGRPDEAAGGRTAGGAVLLALPTTALSAVLTVFGDGQHRFAGLFRPDGLRLAGFDVSDPGPPGSAPGVPGASELGPLPPLAPGAATVETDWPVGGQGAVIGLKRMAALPVVAAVVLPRDAVLAPWRVRLDHGIAVAAVGLLALLGLAGLGWAGLRREAAARHALRDANVRLEQRVEERTADLLGLNQKLIRALGEKERAHQAKARFLSAANHDLRQPFQALRLFHHLLAERLSDPKDRAIADKMGEALDGGEKLLHALLEVATLDAGVVRPEVGDLRVGEVMEAVAAEFRGAAADKGLVLRLRPCDAVVRSDRTLLTRMLRDLLRNAVAYTASGRIVLGCRRRGAWLRIEVWDTGSGIPPEHLDTIFEDFVQLGNPERDRRRGLGLGLATVRRKAALLGHTVEVRSHPGRGSVFTLTLPLADRGGAAEEAVDVPAAVTAEPGAGRLILLVEDDPVQRSGMRLLLEGWGHHVLAAADGPAALECLRTARRPPDVILTDFRLPGPLTGVQVVVRAGELLGHAVPGVILTGDTAPERIREAVDAGCRLLHKPFTPGLLSEALGAVGAARPARQSAA